MPRFLTISPTHVPGKKKYAWNNFRDGGYVAIGWLADHDLTGKTIEEVVNLIREEKYNNEASAIDAFTKFLSLDIGDYVAVNNAADGLFGVGEITSGYKYDRDGHDPGDEDSRYYHFREVEWKYTEYVKRSDLISSGERGFKPFGTVGGLEDEIPPYIKRLLGEPLPPAVDEKFLVPDFLSDVIKSIAELEKDPDHKERAHESIVEDFFVALGYKKHRDIKYRQGRVDISIWEGDKVLLIVEVKRDWNLNIYSHTEVVLQAYKYALDIGSRYVVVTNGDYYAIHDRLKGLSVSSNLIGEFYLSELYEEDITRINMLKKENLKNPDLKEIFNNLSECFE